MNTEQFFNLIFALLIGAAVGLEREHENLADNSSKPFEPKPRFGGARTYPLIALVGYMSIFFHQLNIYWVGPLSFSIVAIYSFISHYKMKKSLGITSEVALVITFILGGLCALNEVYTSAFIMVLTVAILSSKKSVKKLINNITAEELLSSVKFALISLVMLPLLPTKVTIPENIKKIIPNLPQKLLNPYEIWLVVVLVTGIGFLGYSMVRLFGQKRGLLFSAIAGGLVSSTAVTMNFSRQSKKQTNSIYLTVGILLASCIMFPRVLLEAMLFNTHLVLPLLLPFTTVLVVALIYIYFIRKKYSNKENSTSHNMQDFSLSNPVNLKDGFLFAGLYLLIRLLAWLAQTYLGDWGLYAVGVFSGLSDVDAITISVAKESLAGAISNKAAVTTIFLATISNTLTKGIIALVLGSHELRKLVFTGFIVMATAGLIMLFLS